MFDKTFFKFALGFMAVLAISLAVLYFAGDFNPNGGSAQTASSGQ